MEMEEMKDGRVRWTVCYSNQATSVGWLLPMKRSLTRKRFELWKQEKGHESRYRLLYKSSEGNSSTPRLQSSRLTPVFSFLDEEKNTALIRWSTNGDSFVVLDEEEFAKTMIPELFKHANYASFVRQLNMYGFHKKVGLSDNSMRASERKNKSPSEYSNAYFKRGKPDLMWLIQKPKSTQGKGKAGAKGKTNEANGDEDDDFDINNQHSSHQTSEERGTNSRNPRQPLMIGQGESALGQDDLAALHQEMRTIRQRQQMLSEVLQKMRRDHEQQAVAYQELNNRHENSINAILTFLATVYNRSLEGHGNQNMANLFAGALPHDMPHQGSVVDVGDFSTAGDSTSNEQVRRTTRRQPLLLKAPPPDGIGPGMARSTSSPTMPQARTQARVSNRPPVSGQPSGQLGQGTVEEIYDQDSTPISASRPQFTSNGNPRVGLPERDIMSLINSANEKGANSQFGNRMDFPQALSHLQTADGNSPLSPDERNGVLQLIANENAYVNANGSTNNALTSPTPPTMPVPNAENYNVTDDMAFVERTLREQGEKMNNVSNQLQPLSPSGSIPGFNGSDDYVQPPQSDALDFDQIFNSGDYFNDANSGGGIDFGTGANDFGDGDFNFDDPLGNPVVDNFGGNVDGEQGGRIVETVDSSEATSPANTVEEYPGQEEPRSPRKRRRRN